MKENLRYAVGQINCITGDITGNTERIIDVMRQSSGVDILAFPETAITGYCCGALFDNVEFIKDNEKALKEIIAESEGSERVVVVGFVRFRKMKKNGFPLIENSAAIIQNGRLVGEYSKILMANGDHHEDKKYFSPGKEVKVFPVTINGQEYKIGTPICEDAWNIDHDRDIVQEMVDLGAEIIVCPNQSYFFFGKMRKRFSLFSNHAMKKRVTIITANSVGVGDIVKNIIIFDGGSAIYYPDGNVSANIVRFKPHILYHGAAWSDQIIGYKYNMYEEIYDAIVYEQKELFKVLGIKKAQVHVSGGIDSAITAAIVADAMGKKNTILITNPSDNNGGELLSMVEKLSDAIGVGFYTQSMSGVIEKYTEAFKSAFDIDEIKNPTVIGTAHAVGRTVAGLMASNHFKTGIVATGNHTEIVEGWANFHDIGSIGVHAILGDLTKAELFLMSHFINKKFKKEIVPRELFDNSNPNWIKPAAELPDSATDPYDYWVTSGIDAELIRKRKFPEQIIEDFQRRALTPDFFPYDFNMVSIYDRISLDDFSKCVWKSYERSKISVFKAAQGAPIVILSPRSRGFSNRETIINHYRPFDKNQQRSS